MTRIRTKNSQTCLRTKELRELPSFSRTNITTIPQVFIGIKSSLKANLFANKMQQNILPEDKEDHINGTHIYEDFKKSFVPRQYNADITYEEEYTLNWHNYSFQFYHIPGHSQGSSLIVLNGQYAFTGDSLLKDLPIIIRFPGSNKADYENITMPLLSRFLTSDMTILPGHGVPFVLKEIMENNKIYVQFR